MGATVPTVVCSDVAIIGEQIEELQAQMRHLRENEQRLEAQLDQEMFNAESKRGTMLSELRTEQRRVEAEERTSAQLRQKLEEAQATEALATERADASQRRVEALEHTKMTLEGEIAELAQRLGANAREADSSKHQLVEARRAAEAQSEEARDMLVQARRDLKNAQNRAEQREEDHRDAIRALQSKLDTQTAAADTLQALFASTSSQLTAAFPIDPALTDKDGVKRERGGGNGASTPPYPSSSSTPLTLTATARRLALPSLPSGADHGDPVRCVETVFATCKVLQDRAAHYKTEAMSLREKMKALEAKGQEDVSRIRGGIEAQMTSGFR